MKVLYINKKDAQKLQLVRGCCAAAGARLLPVPEDEDLPEDAELMKLSEASQSELSELLKRLKRQGLYVPYKCVETETNKNWPLSKLYAELCEEHAYMQAMQRGEVPQGGAHAQTPKPGEAAAE